MCAAPLLAKGCLSSTHLTCLTPVMQLLYTCTLPKQLIISADEFTRQPHLLLYTLIISTKPAPQQTLQSRASTSWWLQVCQQIAPSPSTLCPPAQAHSSAQGMAPLWLPKAPASAMWVMTALPVVCVLMAISCLAASASAPSPASKPRLLWQPAHRAVLLVLRRSVFCT